MNKVDIKKIKRVYFIGVGGIGLSYLAHYFLKQGVAVSGSDLVATPITDQLAGRGAVIFAEQDGSHITDNLELVIYSEAIPADHPDLLAAKAKNIPVLRQFEIIELIAKDKVLIAVAGNKGKTTTTAILATMLENAGCDPTAMVGSVVNEWQCNFRAGKSPYLVVEADEYKEKFLDLSPKVIVITNIAADHLDYFGTEEKVVEAFQKFIDKLPNDGLLILNQDDVLTRKLRRPNCQVMTFGMETVADVFGSEREIVRSKQHFRIHARSQDLGIFTLPFPGKFNVYNALAAFSVTLALGADLKLVREALGRFKGTWRRFQILGVYKLATLISDYAHNPVSVHGTIQAARDFYGDRRLVAVFQAHTRHRTLSLFADFVRSFDQADIIIIPEIYAVAGRETVTHEQMNGAKLVEAIRERDAEAGRKREVIFSADLIETKKILEKTVKKDDVVLMMGAGDIYQLAESLI